MGFPSIAAEDVGGTGLLWLLLSYGYVLYYASNLISQGSDLLLLVPSMAGLVGSVILPLLGAIPDGAIMLFSGLGDKETAQDTLAVGVGALAGSTIMLLTVPWALSIYAGRVDFDRNGNPNYFAKPKVSPKATLKDDLNQTGVFISDEISKGGIIMIATLLPYFLIQGPAMFIHGPTEEVAEAEKNWALAGFIVCVTGFISYLWMQLRASEEGRAKNHRISVMKRLMSKGTVSLSGALYTNLLKIEEEIDARSAGATGYQSVSTDSDPAPEVQKYLKDILGEGFNKYDTNKNGVLDKKEINLFLRDFNESIDNDEVAEIFDRIDADNNGIVDYDEFIGAVYSIIKNQRRRESFFPKEGVIKAMPCNQDEMQSNMFADEDEEEDVLEDIATLSPEKQQQVIKQRAFTMLVFGTTLVIVFSDPMVDVMGEIANRMSLSPFYVSFILAPLASNASEVIASQFYAAKKTRKSITVALSALEGAASMNNTFCLSIFMGLIYWRGLAWQYTAETVTILVVEIAVGVLVQRDVMSSMLAMVILSFFPLSILLVYSLEALGFD